MVDYLRPPAAVELRYWCGSQGVEPLRYACGCGACPRARVSVCDGRVTHQPLTGYVECGGCGRAARCVCCGGLVEFDARVVDRRAAVGVRNGQH